MKDLDPGRSGREDYNPETEGKPADRSTENNPGGMQGSPPDRDRNRGQQGSPSDRNRGQQGSQTDRNRGKQGSETDRNRDRGMQGSPSERDRDKGMGEAQGERNREGRMGEPNRGSNDPSRAGSQSTEDELNDEDTAGEGGTRNRDASRGSDTDKHRKR